MMTMNQAMNNSAKQVNTNDTPAQVRKLNSIEAIVIAVLRSVGRTDLRVLLIFFLVRTSFTRNQGLANHHNTVHV